MHIKIHQPSTFPLLGSRVLLTRYAEGNVIQGDHGKPDVKVTGVVTETPRNGSNYLTVQVETHHLGLPKTITYDPLDPEAWSMSRDRVTLRRGEFWRWTVTHINDPAPTSAIKRTENGLRILSTKDEVPEPGHGSIVLLHGEQGTAWQRLYSDGTWRSVAGSIADDWDALWEQHVNKRQGVILVLDVPEER